ncbi:ArsR/SmtB family transcription factor [Saccharopolyspora thermophila]|nr:winged helix-turn-helix domain-containing protein [Saccharopolyspora subtropica]
MWELALSLHVLRGAAPWPQQRAWQRWARHRLRDAGLSRRMFLLSTLVPVKGNFPDFLTPAPVGFDEGIETILAARRDDLRQDLARTFPRGTAPAWVRSLADGDRAIVISLVTMLRDYFEAAVRPHWRQVQERVVEDRVLRTHQLTTGGVEQAFRSLPAPIRWTWPVLETVYPETRNLHLGGRGLTLIPSFFCFGHPMTFIDPELPPVLVYPARQTPQQRRAIDSHDVPESLVALLGRTRAQVLLALQTPCSTSELSQRLQTSLPSASQHTSVLRRAGLVTSTRLGKAVLHGLTPLGQQLLAHNSPSDITHEALAGF